MTLLNDEDRVRLARIGQGWRLEDVAEMIGCSISYLSHIERGARPIPKELVRLMDSVHGAEWYQIIQDTITSENLFFSNPDYILNALDCALKLKERRE